MTVDDMRARFRLLSDWRAVLLRAWSVRLILAAAVLSGAEVACSCLMNDPPISSGTFAALSAIISILACVSRLFAQAKIMNGMSR